MTLRRHAFALAIVVSAVIAATIGLGANALLSGSSVSYTSAEASAPVAIPLGTIAASNVITASARGEVIVPPDMANVTMGVVVTGTTAWAAQDSVNQTISHTLTALHTMLIPDSQIHTISLDVTPHYTGNSIDSYLASQILNVTVTNVHEVGKIVDAGIKAGAKDHVSVAYSLSDWNGAYLQALGKATRVATSHVAAMATALGKNLASAKVQSSEGGPVVEHRTPTSITSDGGLLDLRVDVQLVYTF